MFLFLLDVGLGWSWKEDDANECGDIDTLAGRSLRVEGRKADEMSL